MSTNRRQSPGQASPLLATKFYAPPVRPMLVARPRLLQRMDRGLNLGHRLLLVAAPAGYGKTTLAAEWLAAHQTMNPQTAPVAWLSLDEEDNDPRRFFACVMDALRRSDLPVGPRVENLEQRSSAALLGMGPLLVEELADALRMSPGPPILVLDDYHLIQNPDLHEGVAFLLEHLPSTLHLLLLTREDPPLPLARWRVQNQMTEIRARDLRFTSSEADEFLNQVMALDLSEERVALLETRTEGWIAGLQLAALSLQDHTNPALFVQTFAGDDRQVVDYLMAEVLAHQPPDVQRFLLQTSILNSMCADLCAAITQIDAHANSQIANPQIANPQVANPQSLLEELDRRNLFLVPLDNRRYWYRYHHLFADLLRHHLNAGTDTETIAQLHRRAAHWYAQHNHPAEAVEHALAAADFNLAADLIEAALATGATWSSGDVGTWQAWWRALPARALQTRPWLSLRISRALYLAGHIDQAELLLNEAEQVLQERPDLVDDSASLMAQATVYRAAIAAMRGEIREAIQDAHRALSRLPEREILVRARAYDTLGMAYELRGELDEANWAYLEAGALAQQVGVLYLVINARCEAAMIQIAQGQLQRAHQTCLSAIDLISPEQVDLAPLGLAWSVIGEILRQQNDLAQAAQALHKGMNLSRQGGITDDLRHEYLFLSRLCLSQGDFAGGLAALQQVDLLLQGYHVPRLSEVAVAHRVRIWLAQDQLEMARRWAEAYAQAARPEYLREYEDLTLARVWLATGRTAEASVLLDGLLASAEAGGRLGYVIEGLVLLALLRQAQADDDGALNALGRALSLAAPQGYVRVFLDAGEPMTRLLYQAASANIAPDYTGRLLSMATSNTVQTQAPLPSSDQPSIHDQPFIEPLTEREMEVLTLLAERLTNAEICQRLVVSLPTVKSHTSNIYSKLGVDNRRDAVARAQGRLAYWVDGRRRTGDEGRVCLTVADVSLRPLHSPPPKAPPVHQLTYRSSSVVRLPSFVPSSHTSLILFGRCAPYRRGAKLVTDVRNVSANGNTLCHSLTNSTWINRPNTQSRCKDGLPNTGWLPSIP